MSEKHRIEYLGKTLETIIYKEITEEERIRLKTEYLQKPPKKVVIEQLQKVCGGYSSIDKIRQYYFEDLFIQGKSKTSKWSISEMLESREVMGYICGFIDKYKDTTLPSKKDIDEVFRLYAHNAKLSNFPLQTVDEVLKKYSKSFDNYLDFSCGWGVRCLGSLRNLRHYFGIDPNSELVDRINLMIQDYNKYCGFSSMYDITTDIRKQGSEVFAPEWENKMDIAFSSPPYFDLEIYQSDNQSYKENQTTYEDWISNYVKPTIQNIYKYLKKDGIFAVNIKNNAQIIKYDIEGDWNRIVKENGFEYIETMHRQNPKRVSGVENSDEHYMSEGKEPITVYKKI